MNGKAMRILILVALVSLLAGPAFAADEFTYTGVKKCKTCHKPEKIGGQYGIWEASSHAKAFTDLSCEAGLAKAKSLGVENPAEAAACLKCHSTGYAAAAEVKASILLESGVSCEACHGPGSGYFKKATMSAITAGEIDGASVGLHKITEETCLACHVAKNPGHKGTFDYKKSLEKIAHPMPTE